MKLQKFIMLTIAVFAFTFMGYGQVEPGEAPMFGNVRGIKPMYIHDFGKINETLKSYSFKIKNTGIEVIDIVDIKIPAKIAINVLEFHIKPGSRGAHGSSKTFASIYAFCDRRNMGKATRDRREYYDCQVP